jgi:predicted nuclease of predicted toxin-antitoxin system
MRFLVDANLSPKVAASLSSAGFESVHVGDVGLLTAADQVILDYAVLLRSADRLSPDRQAALLAANLPDVADELKTGSVVTIARGRVRIRSLPILGAE